DLVRVDPVSRDHDLPHRFELPGDTAGLSERAVVAGEGVPYLRRGAVTVVGQRHSQHGDPARAIALIDDRLVVLSIGTGPARLGDRAFDRVVGHPLALRTLQRHPQAEVGFRIRTPLTDGDVDLARDLAEGRALLEVGRR